MGLLARWGTTGTPEAWAELTEEQRAALPHRFEAVGEAQVSGIGAVEACREAGRLLADDGAPLDEALEGLRSTSLAVRGRDPSYDEVAALCQAWSDAILGYLHRITCDDPATGLATQPHLRERLSQLYRLEEDDVRRTRALVVVDARSAGHRLGQTLTLARLGRAARTVFDGTEVIAGVGSRRVVVVVRREERLASRVALLRRLVERTGARVWIEGLPGTDYAAGGLLDELARG